MQYLIELNFNHTDSPIALLVTILEYLKNSNNMVLGEIFYCMLMYLLTNNEIYITQAILLCNEQLQRN